MHRYCSFYRKEIFRKVACMLVYLISVSLFSGNVSVKNEVKKKKKECGTERTQYRDGEPQCICFLINWMASNHTNVFSPSSGAQKSKIKLSHNLSGSCSFWQLQALLDCGCGPPYSASISNNLLLFCLCSFSFLKKKIYLFACAGS